MPPEMLATSEHGFFVVVIIVILILKAMEDTE
jgi:hypothetical protein